jgi:ABC-2 type transport system ATP-binding protein
VNSTPPDPDIADPDIGGIRFRSVSKSFGDVEAVRSLDLDITPGETVALLGPNGAGKSTTLDMLLGLHRPDAGEISVFGTAPDVAVAAGHIAAMLQTGSLIQNLSVHEFVSLVASLYPHPRPIDETLEIAGLTALAKRRTQTLSGGESQRVRFAGAIVTNADLLVLDEPTVALDVAARHAFWTTVRDIASMGNTVIFATHYLDEADANADRIVLMARGGIVADGSATQIKSMVGGRTIRATLPDVVIDEIQHIDSVRTVERRGESISITCSNSDSVLRELLNRYDSIHDIEVAGAGIEEAFLELTAQHIGEGSR